SEVIASTERWTKWYNLFTTMTVVLLYLAIIPLLKWLYPRLHIQLKNHKQVLCLMTFPLAQFFAIYTLVTILQQFHAIGTSPGMQLLLGATILLNVVSSIVLLYFMRKMYQKEQEEQKIRFFEEYETLSKQYQTQAEQASQQVAELRHDFDNQMQVFWIDAVRCSGGRHAAGKRITDQIPGSKAETAVLRKHHCQCNFTADRRDLPQKADQL
ncbi:MAG: hypothetical protein ACLR5S_06255, partial [Ruminococcus sp.]